MSEHCCHHNNKKTSTNDDPHAIYTCPMDPEVRQIGPGSCPKCGMALEPLISKNTEDKELVSMTRRFWISVFFTVPLFLISMGDMIPGQPFSSLLTPELKTLLELAFATPICLWAALPFFKLALSSVRTMNLNMFTLIGLGVGVAYFYSLIATLFPEIFPEAFQNHDGQVAVYFEAAGMIVTLVLLGQVLELRGRSKTGVALRQLLDLAPPTARKILEDGTEKDIPLEEVQIGDHLRVLPGAKVSVDGKVTDGNSAIDESLVSGEPIPVTKKAGDEVFSGTINGSGSLVIEATKVGTETLLSQIVLMVAEAQRTKAPIQKLADSVASYFVPTVILISIVTFVIWAINGPDPKMAYALLNAIAVLIIACPCALGLATPMSIMVATGRAALTGILFRNAGAIESLRKVDTIVVDKTGTLTLGKPKLVSAKGVHSVDEKRFLMRVASLEKASEHPLASAIVEGVTSRGLKLSPVQDFNSIPGKGVCGKIDEVEVFVGSQSFLQEKGIDTSESKEFAESLRKEGQSVVFVAAGGKFTGIVGVADPIRETTTEALKELAKEKVRVIMLTGDNKTTAQAVASKLGITEVISDVLPEQKLEVIQKLQASGSVVAMAGDGINDAPALAKADVGIAMGSGADVAMESADLTLVRGDLRGVIRAIKISRATMANIKQNLFFAFLYNSLGIPIAAGVLYPFFGILLSPMIGAAAMSFSSVSVITNSLRLRSKKI